MYKTHHGVERVLGRTNMVVEDVMKLIDTNACVSLGASGDYEYLLFYSPFDGQCKIAVTNTKRSHLISIWEANYVLPKTVTKPSAKLKKVAYQRQRQYLIDQAPKTTKLYVAKILVYERLKLVFTYNCSEKVPEYDDRIQYISLLRSEFSQIAHLVEKHRVGKVHYLVLLGELDGTIKRYYRLPHKTVLNRISKPPAETVY